MDVDDDDDMEELLLLQRHMLIIEVTPLLHLRRFYDGHTRFREDWMLKVVNWTSYDFTLHYHFDWAELEQLTRALELPNIIVTDLRDRCHRIEVKCQNHFLRCIQALCILISRLRGHRLYKLARDFGRDETDISRIAEATAKLIHAHWEHLLGWDAFAARTVPRIDDYADALIHKGSPPALNIFGFIDGTFRWGNAHFEASCSCSHIARPKLGGQRGRLQRSVYSGHKVHITSCQLHHDKGSHGLKYLGITTPDGLLGFLHVHQFYVTVMLHRVLFRRQPDAFMFREAQLRSRLLSLNAALPAGSPKYRIFGDKGRSSHMYHLLFAGFGLTGLCVRPIMRPLRGIESAFNARMSRLRITNGTCNTCSPQHCTRMGIRNRIEYVPRSRFNDFALTRIRRVR